MEAMSAANAASVDCVSSVRWRRDASKGDNTKPRDTAQKRINPARLKKQTR
jgi:hypothetical protein